VLLAGLVAGCTAEAAPEFPAGTTMARLQQAGTITVGVKFDQPGVGFRNLATGKPEGFDIEMAKLVASRLGLDTDDIRWVQAVSRNRVGFIEEGKVDIVIASFSITPDRRNRVGQAGPYYAAGQQLLVRKSDERITGLETVGNATICTVDDTTSAATVKEKLPNAHLIPTTTYTQCVRKLLNNEVDAVTTDDAILLGYAAQQPDKLKVVGAPFTEEKYGIGYKLGDTPFCQFLTETITAAQQDGQWAAAFDRTLGRAGVHRPPMPVPEPCPDD
jgi:glutamate transport system substrate-binding protein